VEILFAGRLIREKHVNLLIDSLRIVSRDDPGLVLRIIGNGPEEESIREHIRETGLEDSVQIRNFYPRHEDLVAQMKSSKVFVLPSTRESFGISALEALACGLPVVTVDHPANAVRELITEKTGFLCKLSPEDLACALSEAFRRHAEMQQDCIATAARYDWDRIAIDLESYYYSVLQAVRTGRNNILIV